MVCEATLSKLYADPACASITETHHSFKSLMGFNYYDIHLKWDVGDINKGTGGKYSAFNVRGKLEPAIHKGQRVNDATIHGLATQVKSECVG